MKGLFFERRFKNTVLDVDPLRLNLFISGLFNSFILFNSDVGFDKTGRGRS